MAIFSTNRFALFFTGNWVQKSFGDSLTFIQFAEPIVGSGAFSTPNIAQGLLDYRLGKCESAAQLSFTFCHEGI
jgi:hypothetical protein